MVGVVAANDGGGSLFGRRTKRERGRRAASEGEERGESGVEASSGTAVECAAGSVEKERSSIGRGDGEVSLPRLGLEGAER